MVKIGAVVFQFIFGLPNPYYIKVKINLDIRLACLQDLQQTFLQYVDFSFFPIR